MTDHTIETRGARITYIDSGAGETAFVFLHYWGGSSRTWAGVIAALEVGARCVALDQRGWGRSQSLDGRYDLDAMADDVEYVAAALDLKRYVLVGHSMGGKVAQIVASRGTPSLAGLVLVAPAPPEGLPIPAAQRASMLASYQSREGVEQAISILAGRPLSSAEREQVIADTLAGAPGAKQAWTDHGMIASVAPRLRDYSGPVRLVLGEFDRVERPDVLRSAFANVLPQAIVTTIPAVGHLSPIESPAAIASACQDIASVLHRP